MPLQLSSYLHVHFLGQALVDVGGKLFFYIRRMRTTAKQLEFVLRKHSTYKLRHILYNWQTVLTVSLVITINTAWLLILRRGDAV